MYDCKIEQYVYMLLDVNALIAIWYKSFLLPLSVCVLGLFDCFGHVQL